MAEKVMKSPGVSAREIDLSQPGQASPKGTPAAIIGTSAKGPAFVPVVFASMADFNAQFGGSDGERFAFSILMNDLKCSNRQAKIIQDRIVREGLNFKRINSKVSHN